MERLGIHLAFVSGLLVLLIGIGAHMEVDSAGAQTAQIVNTTTDLTVVPDTTVTTLVPTTLVTDVNTTTTVVDTSTTVPSTTVTESTTAETTEVTTPTTSVVVTQPVYVRCPFTKSENRTILDFTRGGTVAILDLMVRANGTQGDAVAYAPVGLETGRYEVRLASFDNHADDTLSDLGERWKFRVFDSAGKLIDETPAIRDIPDNESLVVELVDKDFVIDRAIYKGVGIHAAYPAPLPHTFAPLCVALDKVAALSVPVEPAPTVPVPTTALTTIASTTVVAVVTEPDFGGGLYRGCPIPEREGRILVDFTRGGKVALSELAVRADGVPRRATPLVPAYLPAGSYEVRLASYGGSATKEAWQGESWFLTLLSETGTMLGRTPVIPDVPEWESEFVSKVSDSLTVEATVARGMGVHSRYPSSDASPVVPLCASFDPIRVVNVPQPAPATLVEAPAVTSVPPTVVPTARPVVDTIQQPPYPIASREAQVSQAPRVLVQSTEIGIRSKSPTVSVPESVRENRRAWVQELPEEPFELLARASAGEREVIAQRMFATTSSSTSASSTRGTPALSLVRTSVEDAGERVHTAPQTVEEETRFTARTGLIVLRDTDGDGISDYDELHLYGTDPNDPFTAGSVFSDGERVLLGFDPRSDSLAPVPVESPQLTGRVMADQFAIESISAQSTQEQGGGGRVTVKGTAKPYSFVTLYIYSTPIIVTVRADEAGHFAYELDQTLEDGSHELYVATTNSAGKIVAKSSPVPFVKTAQAVEFTPLGSATPTSDPVDRSFTRMITFGLLGLLLLAVGVIVWLGRHTVHGEHTGSGPQAA